MPSTHSPSPHHIRVVPEHASRLDHLMIHSGFETRGTSGTAGPDVVGMQVEEPSACRGRAPCTECEGPPHEMHTVPAAAGCLIKRRSDVTAPWEEPAGSLLRVIVSTGFVPDRPIMHEEETAPAQIRRLLTAGATSAAGPVLERPRRRFPGCLQPRTPPAPLSGGCRQAVLPWPRFEHGLVTLRHTTEPTKKVQL